MSLQNFGTFLSMLIYNSPHSTPLKMLFPIVSFFAKMLFFAEVKIFIFMPKTMDYSPWFDFCESKKRLEKSMPP